MTKPLRILTLSTLFPNATQPNFGIFVERQTAGLAAQSNVELVVINPIGMPPWPLSTSARYKSLNSVAEQEKWRGLDVHRPRFNLLPKIGGRLNPYLISRAVLPLAKKLHDEAPFDLIDAEFFYPDGPAAMRIARALDLPFSIKARGADIHHWGQATGASGQLLKAAQAASGLLAVSAALKADMVDLGIDAGKIMVHYTGLDQKRFALGNRADAKTKLGLSGPVILCVGALIPRKNQRLLIEALPQLPGANLLLAGKGECEGEYRALAKRLGVDERVRFMGNVPHDQLPALFTAADVMALVSKSEGLANVWVEALACGTPVVASNVGGAPELIKSPDAGRIVSSDIDSVSAAITELLDNPIPPERVAATVAHFSWEENARLLADYFRKLVG